MAYSILIVDDEDVIREGLKQVVSWEQLGFTIAGAVSSGEDALQFLENTPVDVLLTDIRMPRISGIELSRLVKIQYPESRVVILSGYDNFSYAQNAIRYGVYHYLLKPCAEEEIIEVFTRLHSEIEKIKERRQSTRKLNKLLVQEELLNLLSGKISLQEAKELHRWKQLFSMHTFVVGLLQLTPNDQVFTEFLEGYQDTEFSLSLPLLDSLDSYIPDENILFLKLEKEQFLIIIPVEEAAIKQYIEQWFSELTKCIHTELPLQMNALFFRYTEEQDSVSLLLQTMVERFDSLFWHQETGTMLWMTIEELVRDTAEVLVLPDPLTLAKTLCSYKSDTIDIDCERLIANTATVAVHHHTEWVQTYIGALKEMVELNGADFSAIENKVRPIEILLSCCATYHRIIQFALAIGHMACKRVVEHKNHCYSKNIRDALHLIDQRFNSNLNLEELSRELGLTATYLSKLFKREVGVNFKEYVLEKQMMEAKRLLRESNDKIYEIAEAVGFSDQHYFSDVFKRSTSLTPLEYRKVGTHE